MIHNTERTLALAGIVQSCTLVNYMARGRWVDPDIVDISLESVFILHPDHVLSVYQDKMSHLQFGLRRISSFFPKPDRKHDGDLAHYLFGSILLARLLQQDKTRMAKLGSALETLAEKKRAAPEMSREELMAALAELYVEHIGSFKKRIHVMGSKEILQDPLEVNKIRALLLSAIRSAVLWNQVGGRLWHLWWKRQQIADFSKILLGKVKEHS